MRVAFRSGRPTVDPCTYTTAVGPMTYLMVRRLDAQRRPDGAPERICEFSGRLRPGGSGAGGGAGLGSGNQFVALPDRFIGVLNELNCNTWITDLAAQMR